MVKVKLNNFFLHRFVSFKYMYIFVLRLDMHCGFRMGNYIEAQLPVALESLMRPHRRRRRRRRRKRRREAGSRKTPVRWLL